MKLKFLNIIFLFSLLFFLSSFVFADNIGFIDAKFCNNDKLTDELNMVTKAGEENNVCIQFSNSFSADLSIDLSFVDAVVTNDSSQNRACSTSTDFSKNLINKEPSLIVS